MREEADMKKEIKEYFQQLKKSNVKKLPKESDWEGLFDKLDAESRLAEK